jgi:phosphoglucomutase/phosphomannomutase
LFWQLPLADKLKYFEIEEEIIKLKNISETANRKKELDQLLQFLGANPIEKIDTAFRKKFGSGVLEYLDLI